MSSEFQLLQKMQQLKPCPFCGADGKLVNIPDCNGSLNWAVICSDVRCKVYPCTSYHETEQEAAEAWNTRAYYNIPDGYIVLPKTKLDKPKPVIFETANSRCATFDLTDANTQYGKYIADKLDYEFATKALNKAGWFKERTCKIESWYAPSSIDEVGNARVKLSCGHQSRQSYRYCPVCGSRVVK